MDSCINLRNNSELQISLKKTDAVQIVHRHRRKRKFDDGELKDGFEKQANNDSAPKISENSCYYGSEIPDTAEEYSGFSLKERIVDKTELKILRMQIAMISDLDGDKPIHVAVVQNNLKLVRKLCALMRKTSIALDLTNYLRQTPLHLAVMLGNIEMVTLLMNWGSSLLLRDRNGKSVIHLAVKTDAKKDLLCLLLSHPQSNTILNALDHEGYTALHYAVFRKNKMAVSCLHRSGASMNVTDGKSGRTVLIHAVMEQNKEMVNHLLECDVNINIVDYSGRSAFELALQISNEEIVKALERKVISEELSRSSTSCEKSEDETKEYSTIQRTKKLKIV